MRYMYLNALINIWPQASKHTHTPTNVGLAHARPSNTLAILTKANIRKGGLYSRFIAAECNIPFFDCSPVFKLEHRQGKVDLLLHISYLLDLLVSSYLNVTFNCAY